MPILTIVDMNMKKVIKNDWIASKCGWTPFDGYEVKGFPLGTIVNGKIKMKNGKIFGETRRKPIKFLIKIIFIFKFISFPFYHILNRETYIFFCFPTKNF